MAETKLNKKPEPIDWAFFLSIMLIVPVLILFITFLTGDWLSFFLLLALVVVLIGAITFRRAKKGAATLNIVMSFLVVYQVVLLHFNAGIPNIGLIWFLVVPPIVGLLGSRLHVLIWTPITLACAVYAWYVGKDGAALSHPLSLPNVVGAILVISAAVFGFITERSRREAQLELAAQHAREEADNRKLAEQKARQAENEMSKFLASISHELRSTMTGILISADLLNTNENVDSSIEYVRDIKKNSNYLLLLINDILDLAQIDAGHVRVKNEEFDLEAVLEDVRDVMAPFVKQKELVFLVGALPQVRRVWRGDVARIRQILINLISNAIKHTSAGFVTVLARERDGGLYFSVRDSGVGIAPELQDKIFKPYFQIRNRQEDELPGTGLGLTLAKEFATALGGGISVESSLGRGTLFSVWVDAGGVSDEPIGERHRPVGLPEGFTLPAGGPDLDEWFSSWTDYWGVESSARPVGPKTTVADHRDRVLLGSIPALKKAMGSTQDESETETSSDDMAISAGTLRGRCLICDDNPLVLKVLSQLMTFFGFDTQAVDDGAGLYVWLEKEQFDLILLDFQLKSESGIDIVKAIRASERGYQDVPICILSGEQTKERAALDAGADAFLLKPPKSKELLSIASRLVDDSGYQAR